MKEVQTLIAALTSERNAIDRAISGLKQMSEIRNGSTETQAPKRRAKEVKHRVFLDESAKRVIADQMASAPRGKGGEIAQRLSEEYGAPANTIYSNWRVWQSLLNISANGNGHEQQQPEREMAVAQ